MILHAVTIEIIYSDIEDLVLKVRSDVIGFALAF